jgi:hypothetical protein
MNKYPTYTEKAKEEGREPIDRQNTKWMKEVADKCEHEWQPVQMRMEVDGFMPDLAKGRVYCVCMKCCGHTYIETGWVGYYIGSPDLLEDDDE